MHRAASIAVAGLLLLGGCASKADGSAGGSAGGGSSAAGDMNECSFPYPPPLGFAETRRREVPASDHVGVQQVLRNDRADELVLTTGIAGEFGEGLPTVRAEPLASGVVGSLVGEGDVWLLVWSDDPPCTPLTVTGNGMTQRGFVTVLVGMGLLAAGDG